MREVIVIDDSESDDNGSIVNEVLNTAPVSRLAQAVKHTVQFVDPPRIPRVSDERSDKDKPDPSPRTVRPVKKMRRNSAPARELFGAPPDADADATPNAPPHAQGIRMTTRASKLGPIQTRTPESPPSTQSTPGDKSDPDFEPPNPTHKPRKPDTLKTPTPTESARESSAAGAYGGDDSDSVFESPESPRDQRLRRSQAPPLRPMFDTYMALVWRRDHHTSERHTKPPEGLLPDSPWSRERAMPTYPPAPRREQRVPPGLLRERHDATSGWPLRLTTAANERRSEYNRGSHLVSAKWPSHIAHLASNFNPHDIRFTKHTPGGVCDCDARELGDCREQTCSNARESIFCDVYCCPFGGDCGNGTRESKSVRLMRVTGTEILTVQAIERIEKGVVLGEYLGELSLETGDRSERTHNEGYRLHFHRDRDAWGDAEVYVNGLLGGSLMRFLNHSCTAGSKFYELGNGRRRVIVAKTTRVIQAGEEIFAHYGSDLWFTCRCMKCTDSRVATCP